MKIYLAAKYGHRLTFLPEVADHLRSLGHEVTSRWLTGAEDDMSKADAAQMDLDDVDAADAVIFFGEPEGSENRGGGRWFELGYAYAVGKRCIAVLSGEKAPDSNRDRGGHESVFTALPRVEQYTSIDAAVGAL